MGAIDPIGQGTHKGLQVPLYGESVIRQQNSSNAIITLMHSTANTGRFAMGIDYKSDLDGEAPTSVVTGMVWDIDEDGGFRAVSGTTVALELNSSGLYQGTTKIIDTSGHLKTGSVQPVVAVTTGATYATTHSESGTLFYVGISDGTSMVITLPKNPPAGTWYDFVVSSQDGTSDVKILTTLDSSARIYLPGATSAVSTALGITPFTTESWAGVRLTAVSSILWWAQPSFQAADFTSDGLSPKDVETGRWAVCNVVG